MSENAPAVATLIYMSGFEIDPGFTDEYDRWFAGRHARDLLGVGFMSVSGYRSVTGSHVRNLYVIPGLDVFGDAYQRLAPADPFRSRLAAFVSEGVRGIYEKIAGAGSALSAPLLIISADGLGPVGGSHWTGRRVDSPARTQEARERLFLAVTEDRTVPQVFRHVATVRPSPDADAPGCQAPRAVL